MSMSTALGLSSEFCGEDGTGGAFSVEVRDLTSGCERPSDCWC